MSSRKIEYSIVDGLARMVLSNEANKNALDLQACEEFGVAADAICKDQSVKAILFQARGSIFSVGGDINGFVENKDRVSDHIIAMTTGLHGGLLKIHESNIPFIIAVNGVAGGGGFSLVCNADLAIAKRSAKLVAAYTKSGLTPDGGGTYFLSRLVGRQRAFDIFATNPTLTADQACELGIVSRVVDDAEFDAEVEKLAQMIVDSPPGALSGLKKLLRDSPNATLQKQLDAEANSIAALASTPSTMNRLLAFVGRSKK